MNIYNVIILDESGSMTAIYNQALTGINEDEPEKPAGNTPNAAPRPQVAPLPWPTCP